MSKYILVLNENTEFEEAVKLLDKNGNGVLPVTDSENNFIGLITDGDIRKAILNRQLDLEHIINKNPYKLSIASTRMQRIQFLKKIKRRQLPLVDEDNKFIEIFVLDDIEFNIKPNWIVIMAGGLGTRLGELTKETPKPMLKVGNKPILEHIIETFVSFGFTKFMLSINYKAEIIKEYFKNGSDLGVEIKYLEETKRLGTGGALSLIDIEINKPFFVINGDVITSLNFEKLLEYHIASKSDATMCVRKHNYQIPYGVIESDQNNYILDIKEKPKYDFLVNTGIYILEPSILGNIPKNEFFDLPNLFINLKKLNKTIKSYEIADYWIDIGHPNDYNEIRVRMEQDI